MPWHIEKRDDEFCVIKDADGEREGCHPTRAEAERQMRALYANEGQSAKPTDELASFGVELSKMELHSENGKRILVGYASAFDYPIPEYDGGTSFFDQGAWSRTLANNRGDIQVLYHHGMDPQIGEKPLGVPRTMNQDGVGLWTETPLAKTKYNEETIIPLLQDGSLRSMSVQFAAVNVRHGEDGRHITEAKLREFGPTPFPRNLGATASLHSRSVAEFLATGEQAEEDAAQNQLEAPADAARLTWDTNATTALFAWEREQADRVAWMTREAKRGNHT